MADNVLRSIVTRLSAGLRESDTVARYGGDEFVFVLSEIGQAVTGSVGVAVYPEHGQTGDILIVHADMAMYHAKRAGPGRCRLFESRMRAETPFSLS